MGRIVYNAGDSTRASRLQTGRTVLGANCPGGESSWGKSLLGRIVYEGGESSMDEMYWARNVHGEAVANRLQKGRNVFRRIV